MDLEHIMVQDRMVLAHMSRPKSQKSEHTCIWPTKNKSPSCGPFTARLDHSECSG